MATMRINSGWNPLPKQRLLLDANEYLVGYVGGVGSGKSHGGVLKHIKNASLNIGCMSSIVSPTNGMIKRNMFPAMERELKKLGLTYKTTKSPPMSIYIKEFRHMIWFLSGDKPNSLKGDNLSHATIDEPFIQDLGVKQEIMARVRDPKAQHKQIILCGTPETLNWGYELFADCLTDGTPRIYAEDKKLNIQSYKRLFKVSSWDNTYLDPLYIKSLEESYDPLLKQAYVDGDWVLMTQGAIYYMFDREVHMKDIPDKNKWTDSKMHFITFDFNVNPMTCLIGRYYTMHGQKFIEILHEISPMNSNTRQCAEMAFYKLNEMGWRVTDHLEIYGDATGRKRDTKAPVNTSDYDIIKSPDLFNPNRPHIRYRIRKSNPPVPTRYNTLNATFKNSLGESHIIIDKSCKELEKDLLQDKYISGTRKRDEKDKMRGHKVDALGYVNYEIRGGQKVGYAKR